MPRSSQNGRIDLNDILRDAWEIYSRNFTTCLLLTLGDLVVTATAATAVLSVAFLTFWILRADEHVGLLAGSLVLVTGMIVTFSALAVGNFRYFLAISRGEPLGPGMLMRAERAVGRMAVGGICYWTVVCVGLLLFFIPGIVAMMVLWPYGRLIADQNLSAPESLKASLQISRRHPDIMLGVFLVYIGALIVGSMIPVVGQILALPFAGVLHTVAYLYLSGEFTGSVERRSNL